jgi:LysR family glycine cleavage system transcriptional activator
MAKPLPPLSTLRAFEAVARLGSVGLAAEEIGRTHGAVSKQLRALQDHAGLALFEKIGTGLRANAEGRRLAAAVGQALDGLAESYAEIVRQARSPGLHVACSATFAMRWLVPHMAGFSQARPDIRLRLSMTSAREMREERDADLVVLWDRAAYPIGDPARAIRLADAAFGPVAAPGYPVARAADGGLSAPCRIAHDHTGRAWEQWQAQAGVALSAASTLSFPHSHLCIEAAVAGMGVALVERRLVGQELKEGRLAAVAGFTPFADGFAAIPHATRPLSPQARVFLDWLAAELTADQPAGLGAAGST